MTNTLQGDVDGLAEPVDDHVDIAVAADVRRRQHDVIADAAVHGAAHRIAGKPARKRLGLDARMQLERGIERRSRGAIGDELDRLEQAAAPDIADMTVIAETFGQPPLEARAAVP